MKIKDIMIPSVDHVSPDDTLEQAALKMKNIEAGPLPVCDRDHIVGILTDRDITVRAVNKGLDPRSTRVREVMSRAVTYCYDDEDVEDTARLMQGGQLRRIVVLKRDERPVGIVSLGGLSAAGGIPQPMSGVLHDASEPALP